MSTTKLEMDDKELKGAYVLMAHDTSHDFFQPKETFRGTMSKRRGGGVLEGGAEMDVDVGDDDGDEGDVGDVGDVGDDGDGGDVGDVDWWAVDDDKEFTQLGNEMEASANYEKEINKIKNFTFHIDELSDIYDFILISKMNNEAKSRLSGLGVLAIDVDAVDTVDAVYTKSPKSKEDVPATPVNQTGKSGYPPPTGARGGANLLIGGAIRVPRVRPVTVEVREKWAEVRELYKPIIDRIVSWDNVVYKLTREEPPLVMGMLELKDIEYIREGNAHPADAPYNKDKLYTFFEWYNIKKKDANKCEFLESMCDGDETALSVKLSSVDECPIGFTAVKIDTLLKWIQGFIKYTNSGESGKMDVIDFIKKKWGRMKGVSAGVAGLVQKLKGKLSKPLLTEQDTRNIVTLRDEIMKWWIGFIYGVGSAGSTTPRWVKSWIALVEARDGNITDDKMREAYLAEEFIWARGPKSKGKVGFFHFQDPSLTNALTPVKKSDYHILQLITVRAYNDKAVGNNVALTSHYHKTTNAKKRPGEILDWLFDNSKSYNCNTVNVADPGSTCPKVDEHSLNKDWGVELCKKAVPGEGGATNPTRVTANIKTGRKLDLSDATFSYTIKSPQEGNAEVLSVPSHHFGNDGPLSKTNILKKVFETIITIIGEEGDYSSILDRWIRPQPDGVGLRDIKEIIQIFGLKMWGDHSQELFSVQQSYDKTRSVFVGNDWISTLRYFHYQKYASAVNGKTKNVWWGGFMGPSALFMVNGIQVAPIPETGPSKKRRVAAFKKYKTKKHKKSKRKKKTKRKKSKRKKTKRGGR